MKRLVENKVMECMAMRKMARREEILEEECEIVASEVMCEDCRRNAMGRW